MSEVDAVAPATENSYFSRRPYTITYTTMEGEKKTITRRPPPLMHNMLPTDIVELKTTKNSDFEEGEDYTIKHISPRAPNLLQLEDDDGHTTFVDYFDADLKEMVAPRGGPKGPPGSTPDSNRYLLWP